MMHVSRSCLRDEILQRGSTVVSVKITSDEEENRWFEIGAYVAIMEIILISEIKRRNKGEEEKVRRKGGVIEVGLTFA